MIQENIIGYIIDYIKNNGIHIVSKFFLAGFIFLVCYILSKKIVIKVRYNIEAHSLESNIYVKRLSQFIGNIIFILLMIFAILAVFQVIGFDVALLMGGISLGIGFAMETTISNMLAGVFLMTNQKVKLGDFVKFLGGMKLMGTIEEINIRYTVISTFDKRRVIVPNSILAKTPIQTYKSEPLVRGEIDFRIPRYCVFSQVQEIILNVVNAHKAVVYKEYSNVLITGFDKFGMNIKSYFFVNQTIKGASAFLVGRDLKAKIFEEFKKYGISIPYQHITLTVE